MRRTALMFVLAGLVGALVATPVAVYASHQFSDVQDSNPFHDDISWLADAGVTLGCGPNVFCPKDNVTREQMAAFMRRLADNQVVDAGELGGFEADQLAPRAAFNATSDLADGQATLTADITAPESGILILNGSVDAEAPQGGTVDSYSCRLEVDDVVVPGSSRNSQTNGPINNVLVNTSENCTATAALSVDAGSHTVDFETSSLSVAGNASVWAVWVPLDGIGNTP